MQRAKPGLHALLCLKIRNYLKDMNRVYLVFLILLFPILFLRAQEENVQLTADMQSSYVLYISPSCPFCQKVLRFCEENQISLKLKNLLEEEKYRTELIEKGGKLQVPALEFAGKILYESDLIIHHIMMNLQEDFEDELDQE